MPANSYSKRKKEIELLIDKLQTPLTMSMFLKREDLEVELFKQRKEAHDMLKRILGE